LSVCCLWPSYNATWCRGGRLIARAYAPRLREALVPMRTTKEAGEVTAEANWAAGREIVSVKEL